MKNKSKSTLLSVLIDIKGEIFTCPIRYSKGHKHSHLNKRGTHVGVILSFLLFITFLLFLYTAVEPTIKTKGDNQIILDDLKIELIELFSEDLTSATISIEESYNPVESSCLEIPYLTGTKGLNLIVKDKDNKPVYSNLTPDSIEIKWDDKRFLKFYYSDELFNIYPLGEGDCAQPVRGTDYFVVMMKTTKYIFETQIIELKNIYETNYSDLKKDLKIPDENEFGFDFIYNNDRTAIKVGEENSQMNIYIEEIPVQYIDEEANILTGLIKIKVW
ncbi:MAG: hypothetical protein V1788_00105 [Nanoarchaeota archaeon]